MNEIKPVILPKDNREHENTIEWWYFNGHLKDEKGREYAFMDCLFKIDILKVNIEHLLNHPHREKSQRGKYVYFAHSVVSDIYKKKNYKEIQNISLMSEASFTKDKLFTEYHNPSILKNHFSIIEEKEANGFFLKTKNFELNLKNKKEPLLEGGHGYVGTPESGSYYYSLTDLETEGILKITDKEIKVKGKSWMDHQWADAVYKKDKWTWFSVQLENGMEIMCVEYETKNGTDILINTLDKHGHQNQYKKAIFKSSRKVWRSKKTKAKYPLTWKIEIPEAKIILNIKSTMKDQEMIFGPINYWEGPTKISAKINSKKTKGRGFMELVGYPSDYNYLLLAEEEIKENILGKIKKIFKRK